MISRESAFWWLILVGCALSGCKSQTPTADPFFGRTTIPPPCTGTATGRPMAPCYQSSIAGQTPAASQQPTSYVGATQSPILQSSSPQMLLPPANPPNNPPTLAAPAAPAASRAAPGNSWLPATPTSSSSFFSSPGTVPNASPAAPSPTLQTQPQTTPYGHGRLTPAGSSNAGVNYRGVSLQGARLRGATVDQSPRPANDASNQPVDILSLPTATVGTAVQPGGATAGGTEANLRASGSETKPP